LEHRTSRTSPARRAGGRSICKNQARPRSAADDSRQWKPRNRISHTSSHARQQAHGTEGRACYLGGADGDRAIRPLRFTMKLGSYSRTGGALDAFSDDCPIKSKLRTSKEQLGNMSSGTPRRDWKRSTRWNPGDGGDAQCDIPMELKAVWRDCKEGRLRISEVIDRLEELKTRTLKADLSVGT
jgi:hypothetical protein